MRREHTSMPEMNPYLRFTPIDRIAQPRVVPVEWKNVTALRAAVIGDVLTPRGRVHPAGGRIAPDLIDHVDLRDRIPAAVFDRAVPSGLLYTPLDQMLDELEVCRR